MPSLKIYLLIFPPQVRGYVSPVGNGRIAIDIGIGTDKSSSDVYKMCVESDPSCEAPRNARTTLYLLEHGLYDGHPASHVLLVPHTGRYHPFVSHGNE